MTGPRREDAARPLGDAALDAVTGGANNTYLRLKIDGADTDTQTAIAGVHKVADVTLKRGVID